MTLKLSTASYARSTGMPHSQQQQPPLRTFNKQLPIVVSVVVLARRAHAFNIPSIEWHFTPQILVFLSPYERHINKFWDLVIEIHSFGLFLAFLRGIESWRYTHWEIVDLGGCISYGNFWALSKDGDVPCPYQLHSRHLSDPTRRDTFRSIG